MIAAVIEVRVFDDEDDNGNAEGIWEAVLEEEEDIMDIDDEMNKLLTSVGVILEIYNLDTSITPQINHDEVDPLTQTGDDVQPLADIVERKNKKGDQEQKKIKVHQIEKDIHCYPHVRLKNVANYFTKINAVL